MNFTTTPPEVEGFYWIIRGDRVAIRGMTNFYRRIQGKPELTPTQCGDWSISVAECSREGKQKLLRVRVFGDKERRIDDPKLAVLLWGARLPWESREMDWPNVTEQIDRLCEPEEEKIRP